MKNIVAVSLFFWVTPCAAFQNVSYLRKASDEVNLVLKGDTDYEQKVDDLDEVVTGTEVAILNTATGRYLDCGGEDDDYKVHSKASDTMTKFRKWNMSVNNNGYYEFESVKYSGRYLTAGDENDPIDGNDHYQVYTLSGKTNGATKSTQKWTVTGTGKNRIIQAKTTSWYLDAGGVTVDGQYLVHTTATKPNSLGLRYWKIVELTSDDKHIDLYNATFSH